MILRARSRREFHRDLTSAPLFTSALFGSSPRRRQPWRRSERAAGLFFSSGNHAAARCVVPDEISCRLMREAEWAKKAAISAASRASRREIAVRETSIASLINYAPRHHTAAPCAHLSLAAATATADPHRPARVINFRDTATCERRSSYMCIRMNEALMTSIRIGISSRERPRFRNTSSLRPYSFDKVVRLLLIPCLLKIASLLIGPFYFAVNLIAERQLTRKFTLIFTISTSCLLSFFNANLQIINRLTLWRTE